jgi:DNA adenine methylase
LSGIQSNRFPSPLRYPGGKGRVANFIKLVILQNQLLGCEYVEPYAGGASVALSLLFEEFADHVHINDLNRSVYAFWRSVLDHTDDLCTLIDEATLNLEEWSRQKGIQKAMEVNALELGFSTFYLNRTSRSGIIAGGLIGGKDQAGNWKMDARFNKDDLIARIQKIGRFRSRITLTGIDSAQYLRMALPKVANSFVYLDPPYFVKGEGLYENYYDISDHAEIASLVSELTVPWVVSYDSAPEIGSMYKRFKRTTYGLQYSAGDRYVGNEQMYFSDQLKVPLVSSPANIPVATVHRAQGRVVSGI